MASIKVKFRPSAVADNEGRIYYQIIHKRKVRQLITDYKVFLSEWNKKRAMVVTSYNNERSVIVNSIRERICRDIKWLIKVDRKLAANNVSYTVDDIIDEFNRYSHEYTIFNFMESIIAKLKKNGKVGTYET